MGHKVELSKVCIRRLAEHDMHVVCSFIKESTGGKSTVTPESLWADLNNYCDLSSTSPESGNDLGTFSSPEFRTNRSIVQGFVAEIDEKKILGYVLYCYFYSPWRGKCFFINDIFIAPEFRKAGIATMLVNKLKEVAKEENMKLFVMDVSRMEASVLDKIGEAGCRLVRDDSTDWSVYRMEL